MKTPAIYLYNLVVNYLPEEQLEWFHQKMALMQLGNTKELYFAFSSVPRYIQKQAIAVSMEQNVEAQILREGWCIEGANTEEVVRWLLILNFKASDGVQYSKILNSLFATGDMREQVALYKALPIMPFPQAFVSRATEGVRSNMKVVYEAVALDNPYASEFFDKQAWNQVVLKAFFMESPLYRIYGLDERNNEELARMLVDYVKERWAADRKINPEVWRLLGKYLTSEHKSLITSLLDSKDANENVAAILACKDSEDKALKAICDCEPAINKNIIENRLTWDIFCKQLYKDTVYQFN